MSKKKRLYTIIGSIRWVVCGLLSLFLLTPVSIDVSAQVVNSRKKTVEQNDTVPLKNRIGFRTNMVDWALMLPNIGFEFDLSNRDYGRWTVGGDVRGNWTTSNTYKTPSVFDVFSVTLETRHYYRTEYRTSMASSDTAKISLKQRVHNLFSKQRLKPRYWRAYYLGGYVSYGSYALKFSQEGWKGKYYSAGVSFGWSVPLYAYKHNYLDIEFGGRLGFVATQYDVFRYDRESNCYPKVPEKSKELHLVPFPVPVDLHASFVYRFSSVKDKYKKINYARTRRIQAEKARRKLRDDSLSVIKQTLKDKKTAIKDSLKNLVKSKRDSLSSLDTTGMSKKEIKRLELQLKKEEKKAEKLSKAANKKDKSKKEKAPKEKKSKKEKAPIKGKEQQAVKPADPETKEGGES